MHVYDAALIENVAPEFLSLKSMSRCTFQLNAVGGNTRARGACVMLRSDHVRPLRQHRRDDVLPFLHWQRSLPAESVLPHDSFPAVSCEVAQKPACGGVLSCIEAFYIYIYMPRGHPVNERHYAVLPRFAAIAKICLNRITCESLHPKQFCFALRLA